MKIQIVKKADKKTNNFAGCPYVVDNLLEPRK